MEVQYILLIKFNPIYYFTRLLLFLLQQLDLPDTGEV